MRQKTFLAAYAVVAQQTTTGMCCFEVETHALEKGHDGGGDSLSGEVYFPGIKEYVTLDISFRRYRIEPPKRLNDPMWPVEEEEDDVEEESEEDDQKNK